MPCEPERKRASRFQARGPLLFRGSRAVCDRAYGAFVKSNELFVSVRENDLSGRQFFCDPITAWRVQVM